MKKLLMVFLAFALAFSTFSCATGQMSDTTKGAAIGAGLGAIAGQVIGNNTAGTLIGVAGGALAGALVGNAMDQDKNNTRIEELERQKTAAAAVPAPDASEAPPGRWVEVPGQWVGGKWVPTHRAWVPVNP
jgi:outer membrane lipoprotein SlyB